MKNVKRIAWAMSLSLMALAGCRQGTITDPVVIDEGLLLVDSAWVIDVFPYDSAACVEVLASGFTAGDNIPVQTVALVKVITTACYRVHVSVEDSASREVAAFDRQFAIHNRKNGDKNIGVEGFVTWDGKGLGGAPVPIARYLWRMEFDFGLGRTRKVRADIRLD